ncbi:MAG TPA: hypothetical protein VGN35_07800 [Jatrophihabitantaceae bacterium]|jgi:hypothetical protein|nr:hypothetical protein [Jatrophihabitantaceae bacterium]
MNLGRMSSAALFVSGIAGIVTPEKFLDALDMAATSPRGVAETRIGLGGTYAGIGGYALLSRQPGAQRAVAATWLGAGLVRLGTLQLDRPKTDWTFWAYLTGELGLGTAALLASLRRRP